MFDLLKELAKALIAHFLGARQMEAQRAVEKSAITRALLIELVSLRNAVGGRLKWWKAQSDHADWLPPLLPFFTDGYDNLKKKVHLIDPEVLRVVVELHGYMRFLNALHDKREDYDTSPERRKQFYSIYTDALETYLGVAERHADELAKYDERADQEATRARVVASRLRVKIDEAVVGSVEADEDDQRREPKKRGTN